MNLPTILKLELPCLVIDTRFRSYLEIIKNCKCWGPHYFASYWDHFVSWSMEMELKKKMSFELYANNQNENLGFQVFKIVWCENKRIYTMAEKLGGNCWIIWIAENFVLINIMFIWTLACLKLDWIFSRCLWFVFIKHRGWHFVWYKLNSL